MYQTAQATIRFKFMFPTYLEFSTLMNGTLINDILNEPFYNFLYRRFSDRDFKKIHRAKIIADVETIYFDTYYKFQKMSSLIKLDTIELVTKIEEGESYNTNNTEQEILDKNFLTAREVIKRPDKDGIEAYGGIMDMNGTLNFIIKEWASIFLPFIGTARDNPNETIYNGGE